MTASEARHSSGGLRAVAAENQRSTWDDRVATLKFAERAQRVHFALGVIAIFAGAVAGTAAIAEAAPLVTGTAAFTGTLLTALQTFLNRQKTANFNWRRAAGFGALSRRWEVLANAPQEPTPEEFNELIEHWEKLHQPPG
jgi:hypothetical protein